MPFWNRKTALADTISSDDLANWGRRQLLGEMSGIDPMTAYGLIEPLSMETYMQGGKGVAGVVEELRRHVGHGEWEAVGAWKFARDFLGEPADADEFIDAGLLAVDHMRITNLAIHLAPIDLPRYEELTGHAPPNDGFFGPPVFDSDFGPSRQFYFDSALAAAASRRIVRLPSSAGVQPGSLDGVASSMWDLGLLIFRGPLVVNQDSSFEPNVVRSAAKAATNVDHGIFARSLAECLNPKDQYVGSYWGFLGAGRFVEDYLDESLGGSPAHVELVDGGLNGLTSAGLLGLAVSVDVLSPLERDRLSILGSR